MSQGIIILCCYVVLNLDMVNSGVRQLGAHCRRRRRRLLGQGQLGAHQPAGLISAVTVNSSTPVLEG